MKSILFSTFFFLAATSFAQIQVSGLVKDEGGQPLPGVNIIIKGTSSGTTTDADGRYALQSEPNATLIFSFIGYEPMEVAVNGQV